MELKKEIKVFKKNNKLDRQDLIELQEKEKLIRQHVAIAQALEVQKTTWLLGKFSKYGLDAEKEWNFNLVNGSIKQINHGGR